MRTAGSLLVLSTGDWETAIVRRNAMGRLEASVARGVFDDVHYVFFRVPGGRTLHPSPWLTVHEVSGGAAEGLGLLGKIRAFAAGLAEIEALTQRVRPVAIQAIDPFLSGSVALRLRRRFGIPVAISLVSDYRLSWRIAGHRPIGNIPPWLSFRVQDHVLRSVDSVNVDCEYYGGYARACGVRKDRITVHPRWIEREFYDLQPDPSVLQRLGVHDPTPLVYVGRLSPEKYSDDLVKVFLEIRKHMPTRELVVVGGDGPGRSAVEHAAANAGAAEALHIVYANVEDMVSIVGSAGVVLAPHAGYSLLEAAVIGAAVIAYDFEWHPELIRDGETGRLVPYRDRRAMASAAVELLEDPAAADRMARELKSLALSLHRPNLVTNSVNEGMARLLEGGLR